MIDRHTESRNFRVLEPAFLTSSRLVVTRPNWNLDGRSIVYEALTGTGSHLFQIGADGKHARSIDLCNDDARRVQGRAALFGPDDFALVSDRTGLLSIWRCHLGVGTTTLLTNPPEGASDYGPCVHSGERGTHAVYRQSLDRREKTQRVGGDDARTSYVTPFPSREGRHISFTRIVGSVAQIFGMRADGWNPQQITFGDDPSMFAARSPVQDRLVFVRGDPTASPPSGRLATIELQRQDGSS